MSTDTQVININDNNENVLSADDFQHQYNENASSLRHRLRRSSFVKASITTEELLVEKLDSFLSSIESRLENFDYFFKFKKEESLGGGNRLGDSLIPNNDYYLTTGGDKDLDPYLGATQTPTHKRRGSSSSFNSLKSYSVSNLNLVHQRLALIKDSVLRNSFTNLEFLYKTLDDQYNYLFNPGDENDDDLDNRMLSPVTTATTNKKELLARKVIKTIQYFDEKLLQIDDFIKDSQPEATANYRSSSLMPLRIYNFNKAVKSGKNGYVHYYELPLSWRENKYIIYGYRFSLDHKYLLSSIFHFHNETMNIWSHLIGLFVMLYFVFIHFPQSDVFQTNSFQDNVIVYLFLAAAVKCLVSSVIWHTYTGCAHLDTRSTCACVDYSGITVLITCSIIAVEYCALYNYPKLLVTYMTFSCISGVGGLLFNWSPYFDRPECRSVRIAFFVGLAILGASSMLCKWFYDGVLSVFYFFSPVFYKSLVWYWFGVIFYGGLIPERWRYDVIIEENLAMSGCEHTYDSIDVLMDNIERSGEEEIEEIEEEIEDIIDKNEATQDKLKKIIKKHFPESPKKSPYHKEFFSLWWVDYFLASHNIWHVCVVLGVVGHYFCVLEMFRQLAKV
ncbi:hemolysin-III related-domain-containing protein [Scheffersomyces coipomensis]|uniref:hemolysin-III related-domain-containing protein n=1 Tax=Scheffersomyces coipomensis TaxID=1788519 RepID=UPI00315D8B71